MYFFKKRSNNIATITIFIIIMVLLFLVFYSNKERITYYRYLKSGNLEHDLTAIELAVSSYEQIMYQKPVNNPEFINNIPNWFVQDDPFGNFSKEFDLLNLEFNSSDSSFFINSLFLCNQNESISETKYYKKLNIFDAFFFDGKVVLDTLSMVDKGLLAFPSFNVYLFKKKIPVYDEGDYNYIKKKIKVYNLKAFSLIGEEGTFNCRFCYEINNDSLIVVYDKYSTISNYPKLFNQTLDFVRGEREVIAGYDTLFFSIVLAPVPHH